jgi:hypothetical protein
MSEQLLATQACPAAHVEPHVPQFFGSAVVFAQYGIPASAPHNVSVAPASLPPHPETQTLFEQNVPAPQVVPHMPQLLLSVFVSAQYASPPSVSALHLVSAPVHVTTHALFTHDSPLGQMFPHAPQLLLSDASVAQ